MAGSGTTVIVGGVAGGMSSAARLRRVDEQATIIVFEASGYVSFANCGLPYFVGDVITEREELLLQTPQALAERFNIDVRVGHRVVAIEGKTVTVETTDGHRFTQDFDQLILAPGARPRELGVPGEERALTLRNIEDVDALSEQVRGFIGKQPAPAVIIGGGFVGIEVAENLRGLGFEVTMVTSGSVLSPLDPEMAAYVTAELAAHGVRVLAGQIVKEITDTHVITSSGEQLPASVVIHAAGVTPRTELAAMAGVEIGAQGGIVVDPHQRTSIPYIYAVGDACEKHDHNSGASALIPLAQTANHHARVAADAIAGRPNQAPTTLGTAIIGVFDQVVAMVGWNEKTARRARRPVTVIHTHPLNHVGYYPGAQQMHIKLLIDAATHLILGAQIVGGAGVDKRIDVIATAMRAGLTAHDLADLELAYAPQFGAAKDPVNMLGFVYGNITNGEKTIQWHELADSGLPIVDVRTSSEFAAGAIPGAINIPLDTLRDHFPDLTASPGTSVASSSVSASPIELPQGPIVVHCAVGVRGHTAAALLTQRGYDVRNLDGGYATWHSALAQDNE